jgi:hypothetical protein
MIVPRPFKRDYLESFFHIPGHGGMAGHVVQQGQALVDGFGNGSHFVGAALAHAFHDTLGFGLLPQLVERVTRFGQLGQQGRGRPFHDDAAVHALGLHVQPVEQDMDETDRVAVENEQRYFFMFSPACYKCFFTALPS